MKTELPTGLVGFLALIPQVAPLINVRVEQALSLVDKIGEQHLNNQALLYEKLSGDQLFALEMRRLEQADIRFPQVMAAIKRAFHPEAKDEDKEGTDGSHPRGDAEPTRKATQERVQSHLVELGIRPEEDPVESDVFPEG